jgi:pimeloyl-ACP methyl ester carboxylesterase
MKANVDLEIPHPPLLFIAGKKDKIIPFELVEKNARADEDINRESDYKLFLHKSHIFAMKKDGKK